MLPSANSWGYRPHLDGLRSVAVYLVVLFHAGIGWFTGGFIGVDLFFVLSGFLVTNVILTDLAEHDRLRLGRFYARRARRLIPAATATVIGTSLVAVFVATRLDRADLVGDARAASLWFANWHFIGTSNDYFHIDDAPSPFLHFWSLSIEEQFYLAFPLLLMVGWKLSRGRFPRLVGMFASVLVVGLGLQWFWAGRDANRAYMGTDARFYQLLVGVVLALILWHRRLPDRWRPVARVTFPVAVVGLVVAGSSALDLDASQRGMVAAAFSGAIILSAEAARGGWFSSLLGSRPVRYLGAISYATYLWHWPVVVLIERVVDVSPWPMFVFSAGLGTGLAALSNELVERPVRSSKRLDRHVPIAVAGGVTLALISGIAVAPGLLRTDARPSVVAPGLFPAEPAPRPDPVDPADGAAPTVEPGDGPETPPGTASGGPASTDPLVTHPPGRTPVPDIDWDSLDLDPPAVPACESEDGSDCIAVDGTGPTMMLIGDSHARMYVPAFESIARARGMRLAVVFGMACPWMRDSYAGRIELKIPQRCVEQRARAFATVIPALDPDIVVAVGRANTINRLGALATTDETLADLPSEELYPALARRTVEEWAADGRKVVLVQPMIEFVSDYLNPVDCLSGAVYQEQCAYEALQSEIEERTMTELAAELDDVMTIDLDDLKCPDLTVCPPIIDGIIVNRDHSHLGNAYIAHITPEIERRLVDAGALPPR